MSEAKSSSGTIQVVVGIITSLLIVAVTLGIVYGVTLIQAPNFSENVILYSGCFKYPQCESGRKTSSDPLTGFTNNTGFDPFTLFGKDWKEPKATRRLDEEEGKELTFNAGVGQSCGGVQVQEGRGHIRLGSSRAEAVSSDAACCSICFEGDKTANCFNQTTCGDKEGVAGDYDYLLLDHIYVPAFCRALDGVPEEGIIPHDPTLTHLRGTRCVNNPLKDYDGSGGNSDAKWDVLSNFTIHGLWPNYNGGYPSCCGFPTPLKVSEVIEWKEGFKQLQKRWPDPSDSSSTCTTCSMFNHEWQKHGGCYVENNNFKKYFSDALKIDEAMYEVNVKFMKYQGQTVALKTLESIFLKKVQIVCDPFDQPEEGQVARFLELRTCWDASFNMVDCSDASDSKFSFPCPPKVIL